MAKRPRLTAVKIWDREDIISCKCGEVAYTHAHCPCEYCNGKAVSRSTEYRHWQTAHSQWSILSDNCRGSPEDDQGDEHGEDSEDGDTNGDHEDGDAIDGDVIDGGHNNGDGSTGCSVDNSRSDGNCCSEDDSDGNAPYVSKMNVSNDVIGAIIQAMTITEEMSGSQQNFLSILNYGKELYCKGKENKDEIECQWPNSWQKALRLLETKGYKDPKDVFICLNGGHPCSFDIMEDPESRCRHCGNVASTCIKYSYLPLRDKIIRWCSDKEFCMKMTAHWLEKDHWIGIQGGHSMKKELWDGSRFGELSWFWDPEYHWILPTLCPFCHSVVSSAHIENELPQTIENVNNAIVSLECQQCFNKFDSNVKVVTGDPRNIALIGHWDGWQPFSTSAKHSSGSIEVSIATMRKSDRSKTEEVYVCGFIPCYKLPNKRPNSLDPFLQPIVEELEDLFINGIKVDYAAEVAGLPPGECLLRCLLILWTGDYPAQCEVGKFINCGIRPCRRCELKGERPFAGINQHYYGNFRYRSRNPWPERILGNCLKDMIRVDSEERSTVRASMAKECGFTGLSVLHRLHALYGFDVLHDLVFDAMHNIPINVASNHLHFYLDEGLVSSHQLESKLKQIPWTPEHKNGRIPSKVTQRLGYWKAEEIQKFTYPASEYILGGMLPDNHYHTWIEIVRITEMIYKTGRNGWTAEDCELFKRLVLRHNILTEENEGIKSCVVTLHNLVHLSKDIERFSSPDNFWCYVFERAVKHYVERSSNSKNLEHTFARAECRREFLKFFDLGQSKVISEVDIDSNLVHSSSLAKATNAAHKFGNIESILVGGKHQPLESQDILWVYSAFNREAPQPNIVGAIFVRSIFMTKHGHNGMLYRVGEHCIVNCQEEYTVLSITAIFSLRIGEVYNSFIKGKVYTPDEEPVIHQHSGNPIIMSTETTTLCLVSQIARKVMLYPCESQPNHYIVIDYERPQIPLTPSDIIVPILPEIGEMLHVMGDNDELWLGHIQSVHTGTKTCQVYFYTSPDDNNIYQREPGGKLEKVHWDSIIGVAAGKWLNSTHYHKC